MKNLREFLVFDTENFFKDKRLGYVSHEPWFDYQGGKKSDVVLGTIIEVVIADDKTNYKSPDKNNLFEKLRIKLAIPVNTVNRMGLKSLRELRFQGLKAKVYGNYSENLSLNAEDVEIVSNKNN